MTVELVAVGTEILLGNIVNTNSAYLARECAKLGLSMYYQAVVGDNPDRMREVIRTALERSDIVILCGGLGPTQDDLTKEITAEVMGAPLIEDARWKGILEEMINAYQKNDPRRRFTANNYKQAMVPEGAIVVDNRNGTAPGLILEKNGKTAILLPGPPNELIPMFRDDIFAYLRNRLPETIISKMVKITGIGESQVAEEIQDLFEAQENPTIATYAKTGEVHLRVTARGKSEEECLALISPMVQELHRRFGNTIFADEEEQTLEGDVVRLLKEKGFRLSLAESCTGGAIAARIVNVPGASEVFTHGFITYSNEAKVQCLGVSSRTLESFGAVSEECAAEMAKGCLSAAGTEAALSVTGIAGPSGGSDSKPVGTVFMACAVQGECRVKEYHFSGNRAKIREQTTVRALTFLRECLLER